MSLIVPHCPCALTHARTHHRCAFACARAPLDRQKKLEQRRRPHQHRGDAATMDNHDDDPNDPTLDSHAAADFLGLKEKTLRTWRYVGRGPAFDKYGTKRGRGGLVRYRLSVLREFRANHTFRMPGERDED